MSNQVAIIGAGISGILACKYCLSKGFNPIVFESRDNIGGVWIKTLQTTKLQTPKSVYQFSDFPWPDSVTEEFPSQNQVLKYLQSYAEHFDLLKHVKFNRKVTSLSYQGEAEKGKGTLWGGAGEPFGHGKWNVTAHNNENPEFDDEVYEVDFVIMCTGRYSDVPNVPEFGDVGLFEGKVMHSMEYANMDDSIAAEFVKGKRIGVVGFQKSGMDVAMECSTVNGVEQPCTLVYRTEHWNLPDYLPWGVSLGYLYQNRFSELLIHKPGEGILLSLMATLLSPLRWAISKFVESHVKMKLRLSKHKMVPKHSFLKEVNSCSIATVPDTFFDRVEDGSIKLKKAQNFTFCQEGIFIDGESEPLSIDLLILATGFKGIDKAKSVFSSPTFRNLMDTTRLSLYRECIHPLIPQLAFIGFSESVANLFTSEMRCRWLVELLDGTFKLPSIKEMEKDVLEWDKYMVRNTLSEYYERSCLGVVQIWYNDLLCKDMGWKPKRKKGVFRELFEPYGPMDYV